jgi:hypothetical protein
VNCIIGGPRAFAIPAKGFQEFAEAVRRKLVLEISDAGPAPSYVLKTALAPSGPQPLMPLRPPPSAGRGNTAENCGGRFPLGNF